MSRSVVTRLGFEPEWGQFKAWAPCSSLMLTGEITHLPTVLPEISDSMLGAGGTGGLGNNDILWGTEMDSI